MVDVRAATASDAGALAALSGQLGYPADASMIAARLARIEGHDAGGSWVALDTGGAVCGFARALAQHFVIDEPFVELAALVVADTARGQGVGAALLRVAEAWALQQGFSSIWVRSNVIRQRAHRFYRREGYTEIKRQAVFRKDFDATRPGT